MAPLADIVDDEGAIAMMNRMSYFRSSKRKIWKHVLSIGAALVMLVIVLPTLSFKAGWTPSFWFGIVWCAFALLIIAAHLHRLLGVDEETEQELKRIKQEKMRRWEERLSSKIVRMK
ncbi:MAG: prominin family protein [Paenibacillus dendritiformis]|uniref:prominin family protein n=1 Tax=Paenibacillus dendritiformis TaxID=130049 RepID=UPI001FF0AAE0|nr:prominin family protein [Paenibacillus dendritiformis]MDU5143485.1 prominin family protein [Paenibacillus dendritiformis]